MDGRKAAPPAKRLLLVEDDPAQLELRQMLLEQHGYTVTAAATRAEAEAALRMGSYSALVMDLRIPTPEDGQQVIVQAAQASTAPPVIVLTGQNKPANSEAWPVACWLRKPVRSKELMMAIGKFAVPLTPLVLLFCLQLATGISQGLAWGQSVGRELPFAAVAGQETAVVCRAAAPGTDWAQADRLPPLVDVLVDGQVNQQVMLASGAVPADYFITLHGLAAGPHRLALRARNGAQVELLTVTADPFAGGPSNAARRQLELRHSPVLFERRNTHGKHSDVPLLLYSEWLEEQAPGAAGAGGRGERVLQYSVVFSNEDGGTSTRALMARWGRTTDIEFAYRVRFDAAGKPVRREIQTRGHDEVVYAGPMEGDHPLLLPVTDNNMFAPEGPTPVRYQPAPIPVDLTKASREAVMDTYPWTWTVMYKELQRENKLRPFGRPEGEKISDPKNYLYLEAKIKNSQTRLTPVVRLRNGAMRLGNQGVPGYGIERDGWVRSATELPPGTKPSEVAEIGLACLSDRPVTNTAQCEVQAIGKLFFLTEAGLPGPSLWKSNGAAVVLQPGEMHLWKLR